IRIIQQVQPDEIYNLAAQSHVAVSFEEPEYTANSDALGPLRILEAIRILGLEKKTRFYQASTSELYGLVQEIPQKETTPFYPRSAKENLPLYCQPFRTLRPMAGNAAEGIHALRSAQPVCGRQDVCALDHRELSRSLRHVCVQRHPVQPRILAAWRNLRHAQD